LETGEETDEVVFSESEASAGNTGTQSFLRVATAISTYWRLGLEWVM
jgi:hypothetical protein